MATTYHTELVDSSKKLLSADWGAPTTISPRPPGFVCPQAGPVLVTDACRSAHLLVPTPTRLVPPPWRMVGAGEGCTARGGARQWRPRRILRLTFRGARLARREGDPSGGRPVGRATRRKGDLYRKGTHRKVTHRKRSSDGRAKITKKKVFGSTAEIAARFVPRRLTAVTFALAEASRRHPDLFPKPPAQVSGN